MFVISRLKRLLRRRPRVLSPVDTVPSSNKESPPPVHKEASSSNYKEASSSNYKEASSSNYKETSSSGNKETPRTPRPKLRFNRARVERWTRQLTESLGESPVNNSRPEVDNINYHIDFPGSSETGSPPSCWGELWTHDPEIRRFLWEDATPIERVDHNFRIFHHTPVYGPDPIILPSPSSAYHSPASSPSPSSPSLASLPLLHLAAVFPHTPSPTLSHLMEPESSSSLATVPSTIVEFDNEGKLVTSAQERTSSVEDTEPESPAERVQKRTSPTDDDLKPEKPIKRVKQLDFSGLDKKRKRSEDLDVDTGGDTEADLSDSDYSNFTPSESSSPISSEEEDPPPSPTPKRGKKNPLDPSFRDPAPRRKNNKRRKKASEDTEYTDHDSEDDISFVPKYERNQLLDIHPRRRGKAQLEPENLPINPDLGPQEQALAAQLHACSKKASIPRHWQKDFMTLPEKLFFAADNDKHEEGDFVLGAHKSSEFYAIRAFQGLLQVCGHVRDFCNVLRSPPEPFIKKTIEKYLRWAVTDAGLVVEPCNIPMHVVYTKTDKEDSQEAITKFYKKLQIRANDFKRYVLLTPARDKFWPTLIGFFVTGPIVSVVTLDTTPQPSDANPPSEDKSAKPLDKDNSSEINLLMYMDLSDMNRDVWGAMFLAILIGHVRNTMVKLASNYKSAWVAQCPDPYGDSGYFSDRDQ